MKASDLRNRSVNELQQQLLELRKEQFNLRVQAATLQMPRTHQFKQLRGDIARIKTVLTEKQAAE